MFQYLPAYCRFILEHAPKKRILYLCENNNVIVRATVAWLRKTSVDLQVTHGASVITPIRKANVRLVHNNCKIEVRCLQVSYVASVNSSLNKFVRGTYDPHVKCPLVLHFTLNHVNTIFNATIGHGSPD